MGYSKMSGQWSSLQRILLLLTASLFVVTPSLALAQTDVTPLPAIRISAIDSTKFPDLGVQLYGENLPADISELPVAVEEDGLPVTLTGDRTEQAIAGTQTAIIFDAAGGVTKNGPTNEPIYIEVGKTLRKLPSLNKLSPDRDLLTTISFGQDKQPTVLHDWSQDHQAVVDSVYQYKPIEGISNTSIDGVLRFTLDRLADPSLPKGQIQSIILFSDGIDIFPAQGLFEAVQLAQAKSIHIHTVMIGAESAGPRKNLEDLARQTGGQFGVLTSIDALDALWGVIAQGGGRRILSYRTQQAKPNKIGVTVMLPDGKKILVEAVPEVPPVLPAKVTINTPLAGTVIERRGPQFDTPTQQLAPRKLTVQAAVAFPDSRTVRSLEYTIVKTEPMLGNFDLPYDMDITDLGTGNYTVRARVVDELGIEAVSEPLEFSIRAILPPPPPPTPDATATENAIQVSVKATEAAQANIAKAAADANAAAAIQKVDEVEWWRQVLAYSTGGTALFGLAMLGLAIYFYMNPRVIKAATQVITGTVAAVTEPFISARRRGARGAVDQPRSTLRLLEDGGVADAPQSIPLTRTGITIGRDPNVAKIVLSDRHISKLHCRIVEDATSSGYRLLDEGSTSGTYIDDKEVDINGTLLKHGDVIAIGPVQYQFEMAGQGPRRPRDIDSETQNSIYDQEDNTEPYIRTQGKAKTEPYRPEG